MTRLVPQITGRGFAEAQMSVLTAIYSPIPSHSDFSRSNSPIAIACFKSKKITFISTPKYILRQNYYIYRIYNYDIRVPHIFKIVLVDVV